MVYLEFNGEIQILPWFLNSGIERFRRHPLNNRDIASTEEDYSQSIRKESYLQDLRSAPIGVLTDDNAHFREQIIELVAGATQLCMLNLVLSETLNQSMIRLMNLFRHDTEAQVVVLYRNCLIRNIRFINVESPIRKQATKQSKLHMPVHFPLAHWTDGLPKVQVSLRGSTRRIADGPASPMLFMRGFADIQ